MKALLLALCALVLCSCAKDAPPPEVVTVVAACPSPAVPVECTAPDPAWQSLPRTAIDKKTLPRWERKNFAAWTDVTGKRSVCRNAIKELQKEYPDVRHH